MRNSFRSFLYLPEVGDENRPKTPITYTIIPHKTGIRLLGVARNPANGFPARPLAVSSAFPASPASPAH